ncbi:hypothetical protein D3C81_1202100 [compost metagenome]
MQVAGALVEQFLDQLVGMRGFDMMVVIDHQEQLLAQHRRRVDDDRDRAVDGREGVVFALQVDVDIDAQAPQALQKGRAERGVTLVIGSQGNPGHFRAGFEPVVAPLRQQGGLAITCSTGDQHQPAMMHAFELRQQRGPGDMPGTDARGRKLGRDQVPGRILGQCVFHDSYWFERS